MMISGQRVTSGGRYRKVFAILADQMSCADASRALAAMRPRRKQVFGSLGRAGRITGLGLARLVRPPHPARKAASELSTALSIRRDWSVLASAGQARDGTDGRYGRDRRRERPRGRAAARGPRPGRHQTSGTACERAEARLSWLLPPALGETARHSITRRQARAASLMSARGQGLKTGSALGRAQDFRLVHKTRHLRVYEYPP
jgi:hypothetical protein